MTQRIQREVHDIVQHLVTHYRPQKVILFGSVAHGDTRKGSDIDLLIVKDVKDDRIHRAQEVYRLLWQRGSYPVGVDVIVVTPDELAQRLAIGDPFYREITSTGKVVFSQS